MAAPVNSLEFFSLVERCQLLDPELASKLRPQIASQKAADPKKLAMTLLKNQLLTEYQARQLLSGKNKGFYLARYKIMELLGSGGMGKVYLAEQLSMERLVAIKLISLQKGKKRQDQALARFKREAKAVAALRHTNIIQAFDYADENGLPYFVMEYVEGIDTARIVHRFGPIHWSMVAEIGRQAAEGLQHAHEAGLVHRDIKPGNLLVDSSGLVKVLDLGLVSAFDQKGEDALTVDQDQLGTVDYIAPEQALDSKSVDARSDIYGLGATLYSIMSGRILFPDKTTAQKLLLHQTTEPDPISSLVKDVPSELATIIHKMLAKKPADRFQSAAEVAQALKPFAVPRMPPYDLSAIKFRRSTYEGFLGKSPEPSQITVPTLGSTELDKPAPATSRESSSRSSSQLRPASAINVESTETVTDDFSTLITESSQMSMEMPSIVGRKKRKPKKQSGLETVQIIAVAGSLVGLIIAAWLGSAALRAMGGTEEYVAPRVVFHPPSPEPVPTLSVPPQSGSLPQTGPTNQPASDATPVTTQGQVALVPSPMGTPSLTPPATPAPPTIVPAVVINTQPLREFKPVSETEWRESLVKRINDPKIQMCYTFDESTISQDQVQNQARPTAGRFNLKLVGPEITVGRFPGKKALRFNPKVGLQHAELNADDSALLHLDGTVTIAVWFKVDTFDRLNQTLIAKGDDGWRIRRYLNSNTLGIQAMSDRGDWQLNGTKTANDGRWHQLVIVRSPELHKLSVYFDGNLDCTLTTQATPLVNQKQVWIGGVSEVDQGKCAFSGWIDEIMIWQKHMNYEKVRDLYADGNPAQ